MSSNSMAWPKSLAIGVMGMLVACAAFPALASLLLPDDTATPSPAPPATERPAAPPAGIAPVTALQIDSALRRGSWRNACSIATAALAREERDITALGIFGLCGAIRNNGEVAETALRRLAEVEPPPKVYATLTQGVVDLRGNPPDRAQQAFRRLLEARPREPLALYFNGEALHALHKDTEAVAAFRAVLTIWPEHAPAMSAVARLIATPQASKAQLNEAVSLAEHAASIEPMNLGYWKQVAELYERTGQRQRAAAVKLQWLTPPKLPPVAAPPK